MSDGFADLEVFTRVVETGSFSRAAAVLRMTPSGVSKVVSRLEEKLGVQLLNRTTRSLSLTEEGTEYFERCTKILADLHEANASLAKSNATPRGRLRVDVPIIFADQLIGPELPRFLARYPELQVDLSVRDRLIDPVAEGIDVVVRLAPARDSELVARKLGPARSLLVASPAYLKKHGRPRSVEDLHVHAQVPYLTESGPLPWRLKGPGGEVLFAVQGRLQAASGNVLTRAVIDGLGIAQTYEPHIAEFIRRKQVEVVLPSAEPTPRQVHALFSRAKAQLPKVRVFVDFFAEVFRARH